MIRLSTSQRAVRGLLKFGVRGYASRVELDRKWITRWKETGPPRKQETNGKKYYALSMFPYPSGNLHIGHLRVYTISDVLARYRRMSGYDVIHPMGWDAFGLPAENAAVERGIDPAVWTRDNIAKMKEQMNQMFADFDWEREVVSCSPDYYRWTQKLFIMMYEAGLAYRKEAKVNWDPVEQTVLANEQVDEHGRSWRSGAIVEQKMLNQWFLGITKYAPELVKDLELLNDWPQKVKTMQKNWIGQSSGANVEFEFENGDSVTTFTTRPDTLHSVQFVALALDHPLVEQMAETNSELQDFILSHKAVSIDEDTKAGFQLPGVYLSNPLNAGKFDIPVFAAHYVISDYGHGAVMGCPGHDQRDFEFWKQNMPGAAIKYSVIAEDSVSEELYTGKEGHLSDICGEFKGMEAKQAGMKIAEKLKEIKKGGPATQIKLRDWLVSRQRFWGAPIPMVHCDNCGIVPVPDSQLPVLLPEELNKPLAQSEEFLSTECPSCHGKARRDSDTMDTFVDSSWYFFRYIDPKNTEMIFDLKKGSELMPVDIYIGGVEHAILHLLYSRFVSKFLHKNGQWNGGELNGEPIRRLVTQGMVHGKTYTDPESGRFLKPHEVDLTNPQEPVITATGAKPNVSYEKMSKSKFNGADPGLCIESHGADATRAHILFQAPVTDVVNWDEKKIVGIERWLDRVESLTDRVTARLAGGVATKPVDFSTLRGQEEKLWAEVQDKVKSVTAALHDNLSMNTLISDYMKLTRTALNALDEECSLDLQVATVENLVKMIAPVVPATAEECWEKLLAAQGKTWSSVFLEDWPSAQKREQASSTVAYQVMINGKRRLQVEMHRGCTNDELLAAVKQNGGKWLEGKEIKNVITPSNKPLISIIAK
ncbi:leucine--tRNA ligase, mitochondrial [Trichomonascus vanleenenianus]|uniref:leucine--tRNA ligase NAM2 n=1 Tax=Trichomonascus vanleenenianus TaxID=2268995 RepID=UPI003ECAF7E3